MIPSLSLLRTLATAAILASTGTTVLAQPWPSRPIRVVVDTTTGSTNDIWSRRYGQRLSDVFGQSFVVDNRPGASGTLAAEQVAKAAADGHTLFFGGMAALVTFPASGGAVRYDPARDFVPIGMGTMGFPTVVAASKLGVRSLADLVRHAKGQPHELTCGTAGHASSQHFACAQFARAVGIRIRPVAYKGSSAALLDTANGEIDIAIGWSTELEPFTSASRVVPLTTLGPARQPKFPGVPTLAEAGFQPVEFIAFSGFYAPAGTPPEIIDRLNAEVVKAALRPEMKEWMDIAGGIYLPANAADFTAFVRKEQAKWKKMSDETGIRVE